MRTQNVREPTPEGDDAAVDLTLERASDDAGLHTSAREVGRARHPTAATLAAAALAFAALVLLRGLSHPHAERTSALPTSTAYPKPSGTPTRRRSHRLQPRGVPDAVRASAAETSGIPKTQPGDTEWAIPDRRMTVAPRIPRAPARAARGVARGAEFNFER